MWLWIPGVPLALALMLWILTRLETYFVDPGEHAERIGRLLRQADTGRLETEVARMLAPSVDAAVRRNGRRRSPTAA